MKPAKQLTCLSKHFALILSFISISLLPIIWNGEALAIQASSDTKPAKFIKSRGKTQVNYNIHQVDAIDIDGETRKIWQYEYVEIEGPVTKAKFKEALRKQDLEKGEEGKPSWNPDEIKAEYDEEKTKTQKIK
ncbi:MAG TPA: hypothetical protein ENF20_05530 [Candidatus Marinimicrobia bacterium]|nr:hypothetical protein [Candidatus Neomarinimicrobiota bacterium]